MASRPFVNRISAPAVALLLIVGVPAEQRTHAQTDPDSEDAEPNTNEDSDYEIRIEAETALAVGSKAVISLHLAPLPRRSISSDGPLKIAVSVAPAEGLTLDKRALRRADATDPKATALRFALGVEALKPGEYQIDFDMRFWVCGKRTCRPVREHRKVSVEVSTPAGPVAPTEGESSFR